jgi:SAM-dependent methyltransferase
MPELLKSIVNPFQDWGTWSQTPLGETLLREEQAWLDETLQDVFGYHAVQIGPMPLDALRNNRMSSRVRMVWGDSPDHDRSAASPSPVQDAPDAGLPSQSSWVGSTKDLPFLSESIDLLVLPHTLEVSEDPHYLLREAQRVLIPEGKIVITGFNPLSLWGLRRSCRSVTRFPPAGHTWLTLARVKDWLKLLNFDLGAGGASAFGAYVPPFDAQSWLARMQWMDPAGRRWWPMAGGVYFLMAVKRVHHMQLVGPAWRDQRAVSRRKAAAASSVRVRPGETVTHGAEQ